MEPSRPTIRPGVLLAFVGLLVIVLRVQVSAIEATASHPELTQPTATESRLQLATFVLAGAVSLVAAIATKRRVNRFLAVLVATAVGGLVTARYNALQGVALGAAIGSLIAWRPIARGAVRVLRKGIKVIAAVLAGAVGGAMLLAFTGNPGDGWHGPLAWSMSALACGAASLLLWHAWRGRAQRGWLRLAGHVMLLFAVVAGQWLSLSVDTLRRAWWLGTDYQLCDLPCDESWLYRGFIGVRVFKGGRRVDDRELATIGGGHELPSLHLKGAGITDSGLVHIGRLTRLIEVSLEDTPITGDGFNSLAALPRLVSLDLQGTQVKERALATLRTLPSLWKLNLDRTQVTGDGLQHLQGLSRLLELSLAGTRVQGDGLLHLDALPVLQHLNLADTAVSDDDLEYLARPQAYLGAPQPFQILDLSGTQITDQGVRDLRGVYWLKVARTQITDEGLRQLGRNRRLGPWHHMSRLDLSNTRVTDEGLRQLADFELSMLDLTDTDVTDAGLAHLKTLPYLDHLRLAGTRVTDEGMPRLADIQWFSELDLSDTRVADAGLAQLKTLPYLKRLQLAGTRVTAAGLTELAGLPTLREVDVRQTAVHGDDLPLLRKKLPNVRTIIDGQRK